MWSSPSLPSSLFNSTAWVQAQACHRVAVRHVSHLHMPQNKFFPVERHVTILHISQSLDATFITTLVVLDMCAHSCVPQSNSYTLSHCVVLYVSVQLLSAIPATWGVPFGLEWIPDYICPRSTSPPQTMCLRTESDLMGYLLPPCVPGQPIPS